MTSLMPLPPGVSAGTTPTLLVSVLNTAVALVTGGRRDRRVRYVGPTPMPARSIPMPEVRPSVLDRDTAVFARPALTTVLTRRIAGHAGVSWQTAARFLGWLKAYAEIGCGITDEVVAEEWTARGVGLMVCGGEYEKYLPAGLEILKQFAGYPADATLEPVFLWLAVVESLRAAPPEPQPAA